MAKRRRVDFSMEEMLKLTGLPRKQFRDTLIRFCDMYQFKLVDFKVDEENEKSDFYFPPEIAEPLALMLKHLPNHPLYRKNADVSNLTATQLAEYNEKLLKDIDSEISTHFNHIIYSLPGHLVAQETADWADRFVRELTHFMHNLSTMHTQDVGATLKTFTKELNKMNYQLYRGHYTRVKNYEQRKKYEMEVNGELDDSDIDKKLQRNNLSLDQLLAEVIRWELEGAHQMRYREFPELDDILEYENSMMKMLGQRYTITDAEGRALFVDIPNPTVEQEREGYYSFVLGKTINEVHYRMNKQCAIRMKKHYESWQPIDKQIANGTFNGTTVKDEYKLHLQSEIQKLQDRINKLQVELDSIDDSEKVPYSFETDEELKNRQTMYVEYCKETDKKEKGLYEIVNRFVGQALNEFLK